MTGASGPGQSRRRWAGPLAVLLVVCVAKEIRADIVFLHPLDGKPLDVTLRAGEAATPALKEFRETGANPYEGDKEAIAGGRALYNKWCQSCHMPDGSGRMGPSLIDEGHNYPRTGTPVGMFEIIYGGGTGAMQAFKGRLVQDEILKVIAYIQSLKK